MEKGEGEEEGGEDGGRGEVGLRGGMGLVEEGEGGMEVG